jgi:hypothetical protein
MKARSVGASVGVLDSGIGLGQYIINQERYKRLPSFVSAKEIGLLASVEEEDVIEDE